MRPERRLRLSEWLESLAMDAEGSARALDLLDGANPEPARTRAKLFREIARYMTASDAAQKAIDPPAAPDPADIVRGPP